MNVFSYVLAAALVTTGIYALVPSGAEGRAGSTAALAANTAQGAPVNAASPAASAAAESTATVVDTKNFAYSPEPVTVNAGDRVVFKNSDAVAHTVTAEDGSFDSGNMNEKQTWAHVFTKLGTYKYKCTYHPYMKGTVIVK